MKLKYLIIVIGIFLISNAYALGCCLDTSMGICSPNTLEDSCSGERAQWYSDRTCNTVSECGFGCCSIGLETRYTLESTCYFLANAQGLEYSWQAGTEAQCISSSSGKDTGACIITNKYDSKCTFTARENCKGVFYKDMLCSNPTLNTTCEKTEKTTCYDGDSYYVDSCGNPDEKKSDCNYDSGTMCDINAKKEAYCKNLNCVDKYGNARKNGESWCIGLDGEVLLSDVRGAEFKKPGDKLASFNDAVGSRFFKQYCLEGKVYTDPCGDYRTEICIPPNATGEEAKCVSNPAEECLAAAPDPENPSDDSWKDLCDPEWCYISRLDDCIKFSGAEEMTCGEDRKNWKEYGGSQGYSLDGVSEVSSDLMAELDLPRCLPKITTGSEVSTSSFSGEEGTCSMGDFQGNVWLDHDISASRWRVKESSSHDTIVDKSADPKRWGNAGLISLDEGNWHFPNNNGIDICLRHQNPLYIYAVATTWCQDEDEFTYNFDYIRRAISSGNVADPVIIEKLNERALGMGDCSPSSNWVGGSSSLKNLAFSVAKRGTSGRTDHILFSFTFTTSPFSPPSTGNCALCGADGLPCSEYRCTSIAKSCQYIEPLDGAEKSYCVSSNDKSPPIITHTQTPANPIPPFSSATFTMKTNEDSYCRFDIGKAGNSIDSMKYSVGNSISQEHLLRLNVPGKKPDEDIENGSEYDIIKQDGKYELFVRCSDVAGNSNIAPYKIDFQVMQTPDEIPPVIQNITPKSGSPIKFNTTEKIISIKLNEPAECRWDFQDKPFDEMGTQQVISEEDEEEIQTINSNQFSCDLDVNENTVLNGYYCVGTLPNITTSLSHQTTFFIRCKDQPWLEGKENDLYKRNANPKSTTYILKPSEKLEIIETTPSNQLTVAPSTTNLTLTVKTKGGGYSGKSTCKWKLTHEQQTTVLYPFTNTNSQTHTQIITNKTEGDYQIYVECKDEAGNIVEETRSLKLRYDKTAPAISRVYNNRGTITIKTDEPAICKFVNSLDISIGCMFSVADEKSVSMNSNQLTHTTQLKKGETYYIKCKDYYNNQNALCNIIEQMV